MQFHSREKARLRRSVAFVVLSAGLLGCSGQMDRFGQSEYVDDPSLPAQTAVVVTPGLSAAKSESVVQRGVMLPAPASGHGPVVTGSVQPRAYTQQLWQPKFSQASTPVRERERAGARVPASLAKSPGAGNARWSAEGGRVVRLKANENVESLSWQHRVPVDVILHTNRVTVGSALQPGDNVIIPAKVVRKIKRTPKAGARVLPHQLPSRSAQPETTASIPSSYVAPLNANGSYAARKASRDAFTTKIAANLVPPGNVGERSRRVVSDAPPPAYPVQQKSPVQTLPASSLEPVRQPVPTQVYRSSQQPTTYRSQSLQPIQGARPAAAQAVYGSPVAGQSGRGVAPLNASVVPKSKPRISGGQRVVHTASISGVKVVPKPKSDVVKVVRKLPAAGGQRTLASSLAPVNSGNEAVQRPIAPVIPEGPVAPVQQERVVAVQQTEVSKPAPVQSAAKTAKPAPVLEETTFRWPVRGRIISDFGVKPGGSKNDGINLAVPSGTDIKAAEDGTIVYAGNELKGFGNLVLIRHDNGWVSAYAHNKALKVRRGDVVRRGQTIAMAGATGSVTQPQLHFELRKDNKPVDPMNYLPRS